MLRLEFDQEAQRSDLVFNGKTLELDNGLETFVFIQLFTHKQAKPGDRGYKKDGWNRGYWYNTFRTESEPEPGSLLWTLKGEKLNEQAVKDAKVYAEDALRIMTERKIADSVLVESFPIWDRGAIGIMTQIFRPRALVPLWRKTWELTLL